MFGWRSRVGVVEASCCYRVPNNTLCGGSDDLPNADLSLDMTSREPVSEGRRMTLFRGVDDLTINKNLFRSRQVMSLPSHVFDSGHTSALLLQPPNYDDEDAFNDGHTALYQDFGLALCGLRVMARELVMMCS